MRSNSWTDRRLSATRLGYFWKVLCYKFSYISIPNFCWLLGYLGKQLPLSQNYCGYFWAITWKIVLRFSPLSGHTADDWVSEWVSREKTVLKECSLAILISALISRCGTIYTSKHHTKFEWERSILLQEATLLKKFQKLCFTTIVVGHQLTDWMDWVQIPLMLSI